ncbi:MAG: hypothetical protein A4E65_00797 [Syntrophorhabdus sp. PtaU1.Bin153]|nr:MAG: hypothetical protein A4E65_00797 [Syntrophorhabdus sp. PtaU1.Bin153]
MPRVDEEVEAIPAGSLPLQDEEDNSSATRTGEVKTGEATAGGGTSEEGGGAKTEVPEKFQGKTTDDLIKMYQDLEKDHGRIGKEVGDLRKQNDIQTKQTELLLNQLSSLTQERSKTSSQQAPDFDQRIADLRTAVESGEMDIGEAFAQTVALTTERAGAIATEAVKRARQEDNATAAKDRFLKDNPDFPELQQSGKLAEIRTENPMHDDFSAYYEYKRREALSTADARVKEAYDKGIAEGGKLAQGAEAAGRVSGKSGASVRTPPSTGKPVTDAEKVSGMLGVLKSIRGG